MAYLIMGHGFEEHRKTSKHLPDGVTLVTLAECGRGTGASELTRILDIFTTYPARVKTPTRLPDSSGLKIYMPGDEYPSLFVQLFTDLRAVDSKKDAHRRILKSGVYKSPIPFEFPEVADIELREMGVPAEVVTEAYAGSVMTPSDLRPNEAGVVPLSQLKTVWSLEDIFKRLGPGVYYYPLCRYPLSQAASSRRKRRTRRRSLKHHPRNDMHRL
jgi:hypothetical protein